MPQIGSPQYHPRFPGMRRWRVRGKVSNLLSRVGRPRRNHQDYSLVAGHRQNFLAIEQCAEAEVV
jgi:hypothetical protein